MVTKYTKYFKIECVRKYLTGSLGSSCSIAAHELGLSRVTLHKWIKQVELGLLKEEEGRSEGGERRPQDWSLPDRFSAILEASNMGEEELNTYCRTKGLFPHHLREWEEEFKRGRMNNKKEKEENKRLKEENKQLKKDLARKDKALAEATATLILKKKIEELWGKDEDL